MQPATFDGAMMRGVRLALASVLRAHPHWSLEQLLAHIEAGGMLAEELASVTILELTSAPTDLLHVSASGVIDISRLRRVQQLEGESFVEIVAEILAEAEGPVQASYLRDRAGGPRWKLTKALRTLHSRGLVERRGFTSNTSWRYVGR